MLSRLHGVALMGIEALPCEIEVDCAEHGFEKAAIVGLPDAAVKESIERVTTERCLAESRKLTAESLVLSAARSRSSERSPSPPPAGTTSDS